MGIDLKVSVVPTNFTDCLALLLESALDLPVVIEAGQILGEFLIVTQCPLREV